MQEELHAVEGSHRALERASARTKEKLDAEVQRSRLLERKVCVCIVYPKVRKGNVTATP